MQIESWLDPRQYHIDDLSSIPSPALIFFEEKIRANIDAAIKLAGGAERLWPHIKTHKCPQIVRMMIAAGINRFKCATLAEAQMLGERRAKHILLAYPQVDPNISRFIKLQAQYPDSVFYALGDDLAQITALAEASAAAGLSSRVLIDVDMGMHRTGVPLDQAEQLYRKCAQLNGLMMSGLHGYDGHMHARDLDTRSAEARPAADELTRISDALLADGVTCDNLILGGTPTFPVHARRDNVYLSPGTIFLMDAGYASDYRDLPFDPAACVLTRVISRPASSDPDCERFTIDLGTKAIASEMPQPHGRIVGVHDAKSVIHSEEHWAFDMPKGAGVPLVGQELLVIPTHICPTCALYDGAWIVRNGRIQDRWEIVRGRIYE